VAEKKETPKAEPSSAQIIQKLRTAIKISFSESEEKVLGIFDINIQNLAEATNVIVHQQAHTNKLEKHILTLETFLKTNGIPLDAVIPKLNQPQGPNRATRKKLEKLRRKYEERAKKDASIHTK